MQERRKYVRFDSTLTVTYRVPAKSLSGVTFSLNLSAEGARLLAPKLALGDTVELEVELPGDTQIVHAIGDVVWQDHQPHPASTKAPLYETGLRFSLVHPQDQTAFFQYIVEQLARLIKLS